MNKVYVKNPKVNILYKNRFVLSSADIVEAMNYANRALKELSDTTMKFDINIFETLGMRNLSGMIGEYFARSVAKVSDGPIPFDDMPWQGGVAMSRNGLVSNVSL